MNLSPRQLAVMEGRTRYYTGLVCPRGHVAERMVSTRACCECVLEKKREWSVANPEKVNAQKSAWRNANLELARKLNRENQKLHRDSANARGKKYDASQKGKAAKAAWAKAHPEVGAAKATKRRSSVLNRTPAWADQSKINKVYALCARYRAFGLDFHVDHQIPLQGKNVSGLHVHNNLAIIEAKANRSKANHF